jgi:hypothetical protein
MQAVVERLRKKPQARLIAGLVSQEKNWLMKDWRSGYLLAVACFICFLQACATREEGCNDSFARNFSFTAEKECKGCCEYPAINFGIAHRFGSANVSFGGQPFRDGAGNSLGLLDLRYLISNCQLLTASGRSIVARDELIAYVPQNNRDTTRVILVNSFAQSRPTEQGNLNLGAFRDTGTITRIRFNIGTFGQTNQADPLRFPNNHPLRNAVGNGLYLNASQGYAVARIRHFSSRDTLDLRIAPAASPKVIELALPQALRLEPGFGINIVMEVDYARWFEGVNVLQDNAATRSQKIVDNLAKSFRVTSTSVQR